MNSRNYFLLGICYSSLLAIFSIIMGDKMVLYGFSEIIAHFTATFIKAFLVWIVNYYLLIIVRPKMANTIEFIVIFILLNSINALFAQWLGMFLFPKFGVIASENGIYLGLRHVFVIVLAYIVVNFYNYKTINYQLQNKYNTLLSQFLDATLQHTNQEVLEVTKPQKYTNNFLVSFRHKIIPVSSEEISLFYLEYGNLFIFTTDEKKFLFQKTLNKLEKELDPNHFFRINRQMIIHRKSVVEMVKQNDRRLKLNVNITTDFDVIVSRSNVNDFLKWYNSSSL